jgi:hypothetical protein
MSKLVRTCLWHTKRWCLRGLVASQSKIVRKQISESTLLSELWIRIAIGLESQASANLNPKQPLILGNYSTYHPPSVGEFEAQNSKLSWTTTQPNSLKGSRIWSPEQLTALETTQLITLNSQLSFDSQHIYGIGPGKEGKVNPGQNCSDFFFGRPRGLPEWWLNWTGPCRTLTFLISLVSRVLSSPEFM